MISDIEIGELIGSVKALEKTVSTERESNNKEFDKLNNKLDAFIVAFKDWQKLSENQQKNDYIYIDEKIGKISGRVTELEKFKDNYEENIKKKANSFGSQVKKTAINVIVTLFTTAILYFILYSVTEYIKKGNNP